MNMAQQIRARAKALVWVLNAAAALALAGTLIAAALAASPASNPATAPANLGPDVVILKELASLYEPVPFDHKSHAQMAQMWDGCVTCHHRTPEAATQPTAAPQAGPLPARPTQEASATFPACKSCHAVEAPKVEMHMPSLKGAYHRQCLNCHREWSGANDCVICHRPRGGGDVSPAVPTPDDVVGRMHPPMQAPTTRLYVARFTPADGGNVLFRHDEHVKSYGLKCVSCHRHDNCAHCHSPKPVVESHLLKPSETWKESHGPCVACHTEARCKSCHYRQDQQPPPPFEHSQTGQAFDSDHAKLTCIQCHTTLRSRDKLTCGGSPCHKRGELIAFPAYRPGSVVATRPASRPVEALGPTKGVIR